MNNFFASRFKSHILPVLFLLAVFAYWPLRDAQFLPWDDPAYVLENGDVHGLAWSNLCTNTYLGNYHPITMIFYSLIYQWKGANPAYFHLISFALHFFNSLLVFFICKKFWSAKNLTYLAALLFFLHPAQVESVAWVAELKNVLFSFFFLAALLQYLNFIETGKKINFLFALILFVFSLLSKGQAVSLAICAPALGMWIKPNIHWKKHLQFASIFLLMAIAFGCIAIWAQGNDGYINVRHQNNWLEKTGLASYLYFVYHLKLFIPYPLEAFYPFPNEIPIYYYAFIFYPLLSIYLLVIRYRKKDYATFAFILCASSLLLPILQFIPVGEAVMADRYSYLLIFFFYLFLFSIFSKHEKYLLLGGTFLLISFSFYTHARNKTFSTENNFLNALIKRYPSNDVVLNSYGAMLLEEKKLTEAKTYLFQSAQKDTLYFQAWSNLGQSYNLLNQPDSAVWAYEKSIRAEPTYYPAYYGLAIGLESLDRNAEALQAIDSALNYQGKNPRYLYLKGIILSKLLQDIEAVKHYTAAIQYGFQGENVWLNRAVSMGRLGDFNSALQDLQQATRINPKSAFAWYLSGMAKIKLMKNGCEDLQRSKNLGYPANEALQQFCGS